MTIKQALKHKNKVAQKITEAFNKVKLYNSLEEGQNRPYDVEQCLDEYFKLCLLYTSPSPRDRQKSRMPSSA